MTIRAARPDASPIDGTLRSIGIDWESETEVPSEGIIECFWQLLGGKLLQRLLSRADVGHIYHCIAVRTPAKLASLVEAASGRVSVFDGDLTAPRLGLSFSDASTIFSQADAILHNGCQLSHMRSYASLRPANFGATHELARLALARRIPISADGYTACKWNSERLLERLCAMVPDLSAWRFDKTVQDALEQSQQYP
ncbi:putative secondary metabolism biosynthetic enzyme [Gnomoniopsis sp. IMI 355080]|nr:putative secondary metabolism biosynthetic enzyme [Gnomoniopsis sp. IMI 355080]